ncbi:MAG TPA: hypothetical protein P5040_04355, partial [Smithella sp.]|nr:hypothetical protein [Smithella sp.]
LDQQQINQQTDRDHQAQKDDKERRASAQVGVFDFFIQEFIKRKKDAGNQNRPENGKKERLDDEKEKEGDQPQENKKNNFFKAENCFFCHFKMLPVFEKIEGKYFFIT